MCAAHLSGSQAHLVVGHTLRGRRWGLGRFLICERCYLKPTTGLSRGDDTRRTKSAWWVGLAGRGEVLPPTPCVACGLVVVRRAEKLMKGVTCSRACRTSLTRIRNGGVGSGRPCGACGRPVTAGRADSAYCGPSCRQKAYRRRVAARSVTGPDPVTELMEALVPFVTRLAPGISQSLYKALYRLHAANCQMLDADGHNLTGSRGKEEALARLASMNPDRVVLPDTHDGRRLRAALHLIHDQLA